MVDDPIKEYFLDKLQSLEVKKRLILIRKDHGIKIADQHGGREIGNNDSGSKQGGLTLDQFVPKEKVIDKDDIKWSILKNDMGPSATTQPTRYNLSPSYKKTTQNSMANRGIGSMDHKQRLQMKAREITYIGQLENMMSSEKTNERANSIAKDFQEQKAKNDSLIKDQLQKQNEKLLEKLKERQYNSFNKSLQRNAGDNSKGKISTRDIKDHGNLASTSEPGDTSNILGDLGPVPPKPPKPANQ